MQNYLKSLNTCLHQKQNTVRNIIYKYRLNYNKVPKVGRHVAQFMLAPGSHNEKLFITQIRRI